MGESAVCQSRGWCKTVTFFAVFVLCSVAWLASWQSFLVVVVDDLEWKWRLLLPMCVVV